jgi:hypothetical protein
MTFYIPESNLNIRFTLNIPNLELGNYSFVLTSQWSHLPLTLTATSINTNERYTEFIMNFPNGFGDQHKNGMYYYDLVDNLDLVIESGLVKIITSPGGDMGTDNFNSGIDKENRVSEVFYRPNY